MNKGRNGRSEVAAVKRCEPLAFRDSRAAPSAPSSSSFTLAGAGGGRGSTYCLRTPLTCSPSSSHTPPNTITLPFQTAQLVPALCPGCMPFFVIRSHINVGTCPPFSSAFFKNGVMSTLQQSVKHLLSPRAPCSTFLIFVKPP